MAVVPGFEPGVAVGNGAVPDDVVWPVAFASAAVPLGRGGVGFCSSGLALAPGGLVPALPAISLVGFAEVAVAGCAGDGSAGAAGPPPAEGVTAGRDVGVGDVFVPDVPGVSDEPAGAAAPWPGVAEDGKEPAMA